MYPDCPLFFFLGTVLARTPSNRINRSRSSSELPRKYLLYTYNDCIVGGRTIFFSICAEVFPIHRSVDGDVDQLPPRTLIASLHSYLKSTSRRLWILLARFCDRRWFQAEGFRVDDLEACVSFRCMLLPITLGRKLLLVVASFYRWGSLGWEGSWLILF